MKKFFFLIVILSFLGLVEKYHLMDGINEQDKISCSFSYSNVEGGSIETKFTGIKTVEKIVKNLIDRIQQDTVAQNKKTTVKKIKKSL